MTAVERLDEIAARRERLDWPKTDDVRTLVAALRAVLALHLPVWSTLADGYRCIGCDVPLTDVTPNCPTVATITAALDQS